MLRTTTKKKYDFIIVGGGVAGLLSAEMLQRSGKSVLLIEKNKKIATESSGEQHCWGQFGYLYFNLPDPGVAEACLKNIKTILELYKLPGNNLSIDQQTGQLISIDPENHANWFRDGHFRYFYGDTSKTDFKITPEKDREWQERIQNALIRNQALAEKILNGKVRETPAYLAQEPILPTKEAQEQLRNEGNHLQAAKIIARHWMNIVAEKKPEGAIAAHLQNEKKDINLPDSPYVIPAHDRPMRSKRILQSVYNRFISRGGDVQLGTEIDRYLLEGEEVQLISKNGETFTGSKVIFTAGGGLNKIKGAQVKTVLSPLLIVSPRICDQNVVYLTPNPEFTINHLHHEEFRTGKTYSIIGNGDAVDPNDQKAIEESRLNIIKQAVTVFPKLLETNITEFDVYFGHKTEFVAKSEERNYHYACYPMGTSDRVFGAVPGKFTLAFSLAKYLYKKFIGTEPPAVTFTKEEQVAYLKLCGLKVSDGKVADCKDESIEPDLFTPENLGLQRTLSTNSFDSLNQYKRQVKSDNNSPEKANIIQASKSFDQSQQRKDELFMRISKYKNSPIKRRAFTPTAKRSDQLPKSLQTYPQGILKPTPESPVANTLHSDLVFNVWNKSTENDHHKQQSQRLFTDGHTLQQRQKRNKIEPPWISIPCINSDSDTPTTDQKDAPSVKKSVSFNDFDNEVLETSTSSIDETSLSNKTELPQNISKTSVRSFTIGEINVDKLLDKADKKKSKLEMSDDSENDSSDEQEKLPQLRDPSQGQLTPTTSRIREITHHSLKNKVGNSLRKANGKIQGFFNDTKEKIKHVKNTATAKISINRLQSSEDGEVELKLLDNMDNKPTNRKS